MLWEFVWCDFVSPQLLPKPSSILLCLQELLIDGYKDVSLLEHLGMSLQRIFIAFLLAAFTAIPLGMLSGLNAYIRAIVEPAIDFLRPLPPLGYYTILILWLGIDEESKICLLFLSAFAPLYVASLRGISRVKKDYILLAQSLGAKNGQLFLFVLLPASLSDIFTGLRIALGATYSTLVAAEMVAAQSGLGWVVLDASKFMNTDIVFAGVILIGLTGLALDRLLGLLKHFYIHWEGRV
ncbi:taurine ABC transporter permease [Helicobacter aurati]|uniref:Taurine ABC transporter permease n=2 Tax=Helicobacter aurati TaxID=137778 RepID=A0A3D8J4N8_9HELI|nr:taurine ABC transporter permease [Helicobacter aurati]